MAETIRGLQALNRRMAAISSGQVGVKVMHQLGKATVAEAKRLVHRNTGNLGRSIHITAETATSVRVVASAHYAASVEYGANIPAMTPQTAKVLAWAKGPAGGPFRRLSGATRKGVSSKNMIFAMHTRAHRNKPYPFLVPGAKIAASKSGLRDVVISLWNDAA